MSEAHLKRVVQDLERRIRQLEFESQRRPAVVRVELGLRLAALEAQAHDAVTLDEANGLGLVGQALSLGLATIDDAGAMSAADKALVHEPVWLRKVGETASPNDYGATLTGQGLELQEATTDFPGLMSAADKQDHDTAVALAHQPVSVTTVGGTPNANGMTLSGQQLRLQPAALNTPGAVSTGDQVLGFGPKEVRVNASDAALATAVAGVRIHNTHLSGQAWLLWRNPLGTNVAGLRGDFDGNLSANVGASRTFDVRHGAGSPRLTVGATRTDIVQEAWTTLPYLNSFGAYAGSPAFFRDSCGIVHLRGRLSKASSPGSLPVDIAQLPSGYRPPMNKNFITEGWNQGAHLEVVASTGVLRVWVADNASWWQGISVNISFDTRS